MNNKIDRFLAEHRPETPCLVVDLERVADAYAALAEGFPLARVFYAVKANPALPVLARLAELGSCFDTASLAEIDLCLGRGVAADRLSFGNTIKKERDIAAAYARGVRLYAFDSRAEREKLARQAPGAQVFCRILVDTVSAEWPLNRKFGCAPAMAVELLKDAAAMGLDAYGVSFHVGSQQTDPAQWDGAVATVAGMFSLLAEAGVNLRMLNLGGGFPATYRGPVPAVAGYAEAVMEAVSRHFGNARPDLIIEPGRGVVGDAGVIESEVVLISQKQADDPVRWVYLDVGKFNGLAETMDEAIKYPIVTGLDGAPAGPVVLAGPTCDSADILYEKTAYELPLDLAIGDRVRLLATGAYTASYASVEFNGFQPIRTYCI